MFKQHLDKQKNILQKLQKLKIEYIQALPQRLKEIEMHWSNLKKVWIQEELESFHREIHSLAGSGGTFGFNDLTDNARTLEQTLLALVKKETNPNAIILQTITHQLSKLQTVMEKILKENKEVKKIAVEKNYLKNINQETIDENLILLIDDDKTFSEFLIEKLKLFGYQIAWVENAEQANHFLKQTIPSVIIADIILPEGKMAGAEVILALKKEITFNIPVIFISNTDTIENRIAAVKTKARVFLSKPINVYLLMDWINIVTYKSPSNPYHVLIVDDDKALSEHYSVILENLGMEVKICSDADQLLDILKDFEADVILMDIYMPKYNGSDLANAIKQMDIFMSIPIVYLSTEKSTNIQIYALQQGGDAFLIKPVDEKALIQTISHHAMRYRQLSSFMHQDSLTGLLNHRHIKERLRAELNRASRENKSLSFIMLDIDFFKKVNDTYGHAIGDQVIKTLSHFLRQHLRLSDIVGRYGGEEFAIILPATDANQAYQVLDKLRIIFTQISHGNTDNPFQITFSAGIASYPSIAEKSLIIEKADQALYKAKKTGRNKIIISE